MSSLYGNNYTVVAANGQPPIDGPLQVNNNLIQSATGVTAYTIPPSMCGAIITIPLLTNQGVGTVTITLPNPVQNPGFNCKFVKTDTQLANQTITIDSGGAGLMSFVSLQNAANITAASARRSISFAGGAAPPSSAGDNIEVFSNGVGYIAKGYASVAASIGYT